MRAHGFVSGTGAVSLVVSDLTKDLKRIVPGFGRGSALAAAGARNVGKCVRGAARNGRHTELWRGWTGACNAEHSAALCVRFVRQGHLWCILLAEGVPEPLGLMFGNVALAGCYLMVLSPSTNHVNRVALDVHLVEALAPGNWLSPSFGWDLSQSAAKIPIQPRAAFLGQVFARSWF